MSQLSEQGDPKALAKWDAKRRSRVVKLLDLVRNGDKNESPLYQLAQSIEREWGSMDTFVSSWMEQVRTASAGKDKGSVKALNAHRDVAKVYVGIMEAFRERIDLSQFGDDETMLDQLTMVEMLVQLLSRDPWLLRDIVQMIPAFDHSVMVAILRDAGYTVFGAEDTTIVSAEGADGP